MKDINLLEIAIEFGKLNNIPIKKEELDLSDPNVELFFNLIKTSILITVEEIYKNLYVVDTLFGPEILKPSISEISKSIKCS